MAPQLAHSAMVLMSLQLAHSAMVHVSPQLAHSAMAHVSHLLSNEDAENSGGNPLRSSSRLLIVIRLGNGDWGLGKNRHDMKIYLDEIL